MKRTMIRVLAGVIVLALCAPAGATQNELVPPTAGIFTGVQFSQKIGDAFRSLASCNKGPSAPANVGGAAVDGLCWIDDSASPWIVKQYVNGGWAVTGALDPTTSAAVGAIGGGLATIASGSTVDLGSVPQANVTISGTTTVTSFGSSAPSGAVKIVRFSGALILTNSGALTVPGGFSLTTAASDRAIVTHLGSGNWEVTQYTRANGIPVDVSAVGKYSFNATESVPSLHVAGYGQALTRTSYPAYLAKVTRAQNGTRTSGNATIASVANTSGLGAGMPVESTGVNAGCTIASVTSTSITLNSSSCVTSSGTSTVTVFLYGYGSGGSASTVGVPDCRNRTLAGRDRNDPGSFANLLTSSANGFAADSSIFGVSGGGESKTLLTANFPPYTPTGGVTNGAISIATTGKLLGQSNPIINIGGGGGIDAIGGPNFPAQSLTFSQGTSTFTGNGQGGTSVPFRTVQPTVIAECVVRVIP